MNSRAWAFLAIEPENFLGLLVLLIEVMGFRFDCIVRCFCGMAIFRLSFNLSSKPTFQIQLPSPPLNSVFTLVPPVLSNLLRRPRIYEARYTFLATF
jgi:hypothetical protein